MFESVLRLDLTVDDVKKAVVTLLAENGLALDALAEATFGVYEKDKLIATASLFGQSIRSVAVSGAYQGSNVVAHLMDAVIEAIYDAGYDNVFVFTTNFAGRTFERLGFFKVVSTDAGFLLMERKPEGVLKYCKALEEYKVCMQEIGAIVMNANPFTKGHLYLVEQAAEQCDFLYVWVVKEDVSAFPYEDRLQLIREGTGHLDNVFVLEGSPYVISRATFPSYFKASEEEMITRHAELDLRIFGQFLSKPLNIQKRFVGTEPYCLVTSAYNRQMKRVLPKFGIEVIEIERKAIHEGAISASYVRQLLLDGDYLGLKEYVPEVTMKYLLSEKGQQVIGKRLKRGERH